MQTHQQWTDKEISRLKKLWGNYSAREISDILGRTTHSIYNKVQRLDMSGLGNSKGSGKRWTDDEVQFLRENWGSISSYKMAEEIDRTPEAIRNKARRMSLPQKVGDDVKNKWTEDEKMFLLKNYKRESTQELAKELGRTVNSVHQRKNIMGLGNYWEIWEDEILFDYYHYKGKNATDLSKGLLSHRSMDAIKHRVVKKNIELYPEDRPELECLNCGDSFTVKHYAEDKRKFCSKKCFLKYRGPTSIEEKVMKVLDKADIEYKYQKDVDKYCCDFYLPSYNLIIEADGDFWHQDGIDGERESTIKEEHNVIHFSGTEINNNADGCLTETLIHFGGVSN